MESRGCQDAFGKYWHINLLGRITFIHLPSDPNCDSIVTELQKLASTVSWSDTYAGPVIWVKEQDAAKIPQLIQCVLDWGNKVWMNDGSQLTLKSGFLYTTENVEIALLAMYQNMKSISVIGWSCAASTLSREFILADSFSYEPLQEFLLQEFPQQNAQFRESQLRESQLLPESPKKK